VPGPRKIYVTIGHGEITSPDSVPAELKRRIPERRTSELDKELGKLGLERAELGVAELARDVPEDAAIVFLLAPMVPLLPAEWDALGRYLDRGGRLLIALDPMGDPGLGALEGKLGIRFNGAHLTDDREYVQARRTLTDRRLVLTTQFSAHPSVAGLARNGKALILIDAGALEEAPFATRGTPPQRTMTIRSADSSWLDLDDNFKLDGGTERRQRWNVGAAVEGPRDGTGRGFRALVFADVDLFADVVIATPADGPRTVLASGPLLADAVRWLGE
jgi:hypothetical protein